MKDFIQHNRRVYNKIAAHFSNTRTTIWDDLLPLGKYTKPGDRILDVGCGNGRLYQLFKNLSIEYIGVDLSKGLIEIAKRNVTRGHFIVADMRQLPFENNYFDIVYCIAAFHHLPDETSRLKALKEMKRVVKSGGYVILSNWNLTNIRTTKITKLRKIAEDEWRDVMVPWRNDKGEVLGERYYHAFTTDELSNLFLKAGFVVIDQYYTSKGKRGDGVNISGNIISILKKPA